MAGIQSLSTELLLQIFGTLDTIQDVLALSSTCRGLHGIYTSTQQLPILVAAAERQHGPSRTPCGLLRTTRASRRSRPAWAPQPRLSP